MPGFIQPDCPVHSLLPMGTPPKSQCFLKVMTKAILQAAEWPHLCPADLKCSRSLFKMSDAETKGNGQLPGEAASNK